MGILSKSQGAISVDIIMITLENAAIMSFSSTVASPKDPYIARLQHLADSTRPLSITSLFEKDDRRFDTFSRQGAGVYLDFSKQKLTQAVLDALLDWAQAKSLPAKIAGFFAGDMVNTTERRAALHTVLRASPEQQRQRLGEELAGEVQRTFKRMAAFVDAVHAGEHRGYDGQCITHVIALGIGGSFLAPKLCHQALQPYWREGIEVQFVANADGAAIARKLTKLDPATTLVVVVSKTFTTQETLLNATACRQWLLDGGCPETKLDHHLIAVSSNTDKARAFGVADENVLPMWDWVGGRFSVWSAAGLPLALAVGMEHFYALLSGAGEMDKHVQTAPLAANLPVLHALIGIWNRSFLDHSALAIMPYDHSLRGLPGYIQQLDMESTGKGVDLQGKIVSLPTSPNVFGQEGTNGQHAFMQMIHQGREVIPGEFILPLRSHYAVANHHQVLTAHCFAQSQAMMAGKSLAQATDELMSQGLSVADAEQLAPHKVMPGDRPSSTLLIDKLTPETLGSLLALYEHKVFVQGVMWNVNPFDQWGVEYGKVLSSDILSALASGSTDVEPASQGLVGLFHQGLG